MCELQTENVFKLLQEIWLVNGRFPAILPADIRNTSSHENYKSILKTHLFKVTFTDR